MFGIFRKQIRWFVDCKYMFVPEVSALNTGQRPVKGCNEWGKNINISDHKLFRKFLWYGPTEVGAKINDESRLFVKKKSKNIFWSEKKWFVKNLTEKLGNTDTREIRPFFFLVVSCPWVLQNRKTKPPQVIQFLGISPHTKLCIKILSSTSILFLYV